MRITFTIFAAWLALSTPVALIVGRMMRRLPPPPPVRTVDDWSPVTVDAEFWALIQEGVQR